MRRDARKKAIAGTEAAAEIRKRRERGKRNIEIIRRNTAHFSCNDCRLEVVTKKYSA